MKEKYLVTKNAKFATMAFESERLGDTNNTALTPVAVYVNQDIENSYFKLFRTKSIRECWLECRADTNCRAVSFSGTCYFYAPLKSKNNSDNKFRTRKSINFISVSYHGEPFI